MYDTPYSKKFDDFYFSRKDGLAETQYVFLKGNNLPQSWEGRENFSICETGFGTGLNFFATWDLFEKTAQKNQSLDFVSIEKYPLSIEEINNALNPWADIFKNKIKIFCDLYPLRVRGVHRIKINSQITLTLIFDDVNAVMPTLIEKFDCWFLDGFTPAKNPQMWTDILFENMKRLSHPNASFATFTAAHKVREGLERFGFNVQKQKGFGYKSDMTIGFIQKEIENKKPKLKQGASIAIIGGGLSGTACAYTLKQYGFNPIIYEASQTLGAGASGNECGFYNPRFCALWNFSAQFFSPAYAQFISIAKRAGDDVNYNPCGSLHLINSSDKKKRFSAMLKNWQWHEDHLKILNQSESSNIAGIHINEDALYLPDSGSVNVKKLCHYYAQDIEVRTKHKIEDYTHLNEDIIILCNAHAALEFSGMNFIPLKKVRGQITKVQSTKHSQNLQCNIHFGKYISAAQNGMHHIGATFQPWEQEIDLVHEENFENINAIQEQISDLKNEDFEITGGWAQYRCASKDHFPIIGRVPHEKNVFTSLAFGSHGLVGSIQSAHILADLLRGKEHCLQFDMKKNIDYQRFSLRRQQKIKNA